MTHPTPTAATSASPRGFGRPRRVRIHGAPWLGAPLLTLLLTTPTLAQVIPTGTPAADILLSQAISEHRVFLTCSALDGYVHPLVLQNWQREVDAATATLTANHVDPKAIAAFTLAAKPENLLPAPDTPWFEVKQFCDTYPDWQADYAKLNFTILELKLPRVFE